MPRKPTKNRINMHDIIEQPLEAIPGAVDAVLRRPEKLDEMEVENIFYECSYIMLRAEEALSSKDNDAFCFLFRLLSEGLAHSEASFEKGIQTFALHGPLLQTMHSLFRVVIERGAFPLHSSSAVELVQVIASLSDGEALKETCGSLFMSGLTQLLKRLYADPVEAQSTYNLQRAAATALINLVKGSKQNKLRLSSCGFLADCCVTSVDVFFQLQCIELLYRISRKCRDILHQLHDEERRLMLEKLLAFPNDGSLLAHMVALVQEINAGREEVHQYAVTRVTAADTVLTEGTDAFFTPHYFVVMVTTTNADNVTIPYRSIRSVTLGKDGRVIFRLEAFPQKLEALLSHTLGMDSLTLLLSPERLIAFKQSSIRSWILAALQQRKTSARTSPEDSRLPKANLVTAPEVKAADSSGWSRSSPLIRESDTDGALPEACPARADSIRKRLKMEDGGISLAQTENKTTVNEIIAILDSLLQSLSSRKEGQTILSQLKRIIDTKFEIYQGEMADALSNTMGSLQRMVDETRQEAKNMRRRWQAEMEKRVEQIDLHNSETQEQAARAVRCLNDDLHSVKSSNQAISERIACLEIALQQTLEESHDAEENALRLLRSHTEKEIQRQESELDSELLSRYSFASAATNHD